MMSPRLSLLALGALLAGPLAAQTSEPSARRAPSGFAVLDSSSRIPGLDRLVTLSAREVPLRDVVTRIAEQANVGFTFDPALGGLDTPVRVDSMRTTAGAALLRVLSGTPIQALASPTGHVVLVARPVREPKSPLVTGRVQTTDGGALIGTRVDLVGTRFGGLSREDGSFSLGQIPPGEYTLRAMHIGYRPVVRPVVVDADGDISPLQVSLESAPVPLEAMVVTPGYFGFLQPSLATAQVLSRHKIETAPQLGEDIFRVVNRFPGVTGNNFSAKLSVRGGLPDELYVSLDGVQLIEPFHLKDMGGALSILDMQALGAADLTTGAPSVEFGNELAGVFAMHSLEPRTDRARTSVGASIMNVRGLSQGGFADGRGGWLLSARRGFLEAAFKLANMGDSISPRYEDVFAKVRYNLLGAGEITAHALYAGDYLDYLDTPDPSIHSKYTSTYAWLTWNATFGLRVRQQAMVSTGHVGWRRNGNGAERGRQTAAIHDTRSLSLVGFKQDWTIDIAARAMLKAGIDARHERASYDYFSWVERRAVTPSKTVHWYNDTTQASAAPASDRLSAYIAPRFRLFPTLTIETGLRFDRASHSGDRLVSPRFNASWEPRRGTTVRGAWGRYTQTQPLFALQVEDGVTQFYPAEESDQRVIGIEQVLPRGFVARAEAYDRRLSHIRPRFTNASPSIDVFPELTPDRLHLQPNVGRSRGLEFFLGRDGGERIDWGLSYGRASATENIDGRVVPRSLDQRHTVALDWSLHPVSNKWRLSVATLWHTGWPHTPSVVTVDTIVNTPQQFGVTGTWTYPNVNSARLPNYRRVDARWTRFVDTKKGRVAFFFEVFNLLNTQNVRGYSTNLSVNSARRVSFVQDPSAEIPRLPSAGISWEF